MMSKDKFRFMVLCEDEKHFNFVSGYLQARGAKQRKIYANITREGSGEQPVRENFVKEVKALRQRARENIVLIVVVTDADKYSSEERLKTLIDTLEEPLSKKERIVILIPARNIETWFHYANNPMACDETTDYKSKYEKNSLLPSMVKNMPKTSAPDYQRTPCRL